MQLEPEAVELVDRTMIDLGRSIPIYRATIDDMLMGEPESLLIVEFHGDEDGKLRAKLRELEDLMAFWAVLTWCARSNPDSRPTSPPCAKPG